MIEFEGVVLLSADAVSAQLMISLVEQTEGAALASGATPDVGAGDDAVLQDLSQEPDDQWIASLLSGASAGAVAAGMLSPSEVILLDSQSNDEPDIIITGRREYEADWGTGSGDTGGGGGGSGGDGGGGGGEAGGTPVEQHTEDCGTEDGAAVQVADHVMGTLPPGVSGPEDPVTTSTGNDWRTVEFGAVIVRNSDGSFGALNNMIYSSNQSGYVALPDSTGQPVQGLWHSHPKRDTTDQQAIDRYPSSADWNALARVGSQAGAVGDPSLWLTGPDGVTREFKLSERSSVEGLGVEKMKNGDGLPGRERTQSCG